MTKMTLQFKETFKMFLYKFPKSLFYLVEHFYIYLHLAKNLTDIVLFKAGHEL